MAMQWAPAQPPRSEEEDWYAAADEEGEEEEEEHLEEEGEEAAGGVDVQAAAGAAAGDVDVGVVANAAAGGVDMQAATVDVLEQAPSDISLVYRRLAITVVQRSIARIIGSSQEVAPQPLMAIQRFHVL